MDAAPRRVVLASLGGRQAELQVMGRLALVAEEEVAATEEEVIAPGDLRIVQPIQRGLVAEQQGDELLERPEGHQ